jgi:predicted flap endonuclease-1-like 5' DNA nuclease
MKKPESTHPNADAFPRGMSGPSLRALANAKLRSMADVAKWSEDDLAALHGMGPKALKILRQELKARGRALRGAARA